MTTKIQYPLTLTPNGSIATVSEPVQIARGVIRSVLMTSVGERPLRPEYGTLPGIFGDRDNVRSALTTAIRAELPGIVDRWTLKTKPTTDDGIRQHTVTFEAGGRDYVYP